jgi:hypothetical protein
MASGTGVHASAIGSVAGEGTLSAVAALSLASAAIASDVAWSLAGVLASSGGMWF